MGAFVGLRLKSLYMFKINVQPLAPHRSGACLEAAIGKPSFKALQLTKEFMEMQLGR